MAATTDAANERRKSPTSADHRNTDRTSISPARQRSPETSVYSTKAPDASERPVREQLKKTSITTTNIVPSKAAQSEEAKAEDTLSEAGSVGTDSKNSDVDAETCSTRGRPRRKRSFEELEVDHTDGRAGTSGSKHLRKRSRASENNELVDDESSQESIARVEVQVQDDIKSSSEPSVLEVAVRDEDGPSKRPVTPPAGLASAVLPAEDMAISPQNKRNRDQFIKDHEAIPKRQSIHENGSDITPEANEDGEVLGTSKVAADEPYSKRPRDETLPQSGDKKPTSVSKIPSSSGFANTSVQSPFSSLASSKSPSTNLQTSSAAFASSGFASFAGTTQSPFGKVGSSATTTNTKNDKPEIVTTESELPSGFGTLGGVAPSTFAAPGSSAFGSGISGFGKLSNGFGAASGFGSTPLSNFATPGSSGIIGLTSKTSRPIGTVADGNDDETAEGETKEEEGGNGEKVLLSTKDSDKDARFFEQDVETGEEEEETVFNSRAKLYVSQDKQWKERGVGTLKVNIAYDFEQELDDGAEPSRKKSARFIMRADGSHRIVLNSPIQKEITIEDPTGGPPKGKTAIFLGFIDDKPMLMQLKMRSNAQTEELRRVITSLLETL